MKRNKRTAVLLVLIMALTTMLSISIAWASEGGQSAKAQPRTIMECTRSFEAISSTKAEADISGVSSGTTPYITSKVTLQSAPLGGTSFTNVSGVSPETYTVYNAPSIWHICTFPITSSKDYRIKIQLTDEVNGMKITSTYYKTLAR